MSPKMPKSYLEARKREIVEAAIKCYIEKGYHNVTMQDIYQTTELSPGAVYNYFKGKEEIFAEAARMSQEKNDLMFSEYVTKNTEYPLSELGKLYMETIRQIDIQKVTALNLSLYAEAVRNPELAETLRENYKNVLNHVTEIVENYQADGRISGNLDAESVSRVILNILTGIGLQYIFEPDVNMELYLETYDAIIKGEFSINS